MRTSGVFQRILKDSGVYAIAVVVQRAASLIMLPVYTRYLSAADYGVMALLDLAGELASIVVGIRVGQALLFYYNNPSADDSRARSRYVSTAFWGAFMIGIATGVLGALGAGTVSNWLFNSPRYESFVRLFFASFALGMPIEVGLCYLRAASRPKAYIAVSLIRMAASIALSLLFLMVYRMGVAAMLWSSVLSSLGSTVYLSVVVVRRTGVAFDGRRFLHVVHYSLPLGISAAGWFVLHFGDRIFLRSAVSLSDLGIYSVAYKIGMLIAYVQMPFSLFWRAQMFELVRGPEGERVYVRLCTYIGLGLSLALILLSAASRPALALFVGPEFQRAAAFIPWVGLAYVIRALADHFGSVFFLENRTGRDALSTTTAAVVCLGAYALLVPTFKLWGAIFATLIGFTALLIVSLWQGQKIRHFHFEVRRLMLVFLATALPLAGSALLRPVLLCQQILLAAVLLCSFLAVLLVSGFFSSAEINMARAVIQRVKGAIFVRVAIG